MFNWLFKKEDKQDLDEHKQAVQTALNKVKQDMDHVGKWLKHLNETDSDLKKDVEEIKEDLYSIKNDLQELKEMIKQPEEKNSFQILKQPQTAKVKQTTVYLTLVLSTNIFPITIKMTLINYVKKVMVQ